MNQIPMPRLLFHLVLSSGFRFSALCVNSTSGGERSLATPAYQGRLALLSLPRGAAVNKIKGATLLTTLTPPSAQGRPLAPQLGMSDFFVSKKGSKRQTYHCRADMSATCQPTCHRHAPNPRQRGYRHCRTGMLTPTCRHVLT